MRVLMLNPPFLPGYSRGQRSPAVTRSGTLYYPIWLAYAAGALEDAGHEVLLLDAPAERAGFDEVMERVRAFAPHLAVVETSTPSVESDAAFADRLAGEAETVLLAGTHPSALPELTLELGDRFDGLVVGEYELPLLGVCRALEAGTGLEEVGGLCLRGPEGPVRTGPGGRVEDLDSLPWVSRVYARHLPVERYNNPNALHPQVMVMGGRGCPFGCSFCVFPQTLTGRRFRFRSVEDVVGEMLWVQENMPQVRAVFFEDDTISVDRRRLRELAGEMRRRGVEISWTANMRADVDYETLLECRKAGLRTVCVGFESGSPRLLRNMGKGITPDRMRRFAGDARRAGVLFHGCFMVGIRGETAETMEQTLKLALELDPDTAQFYPLMVYPGTRAYREAEEDGNLLPSSWRDWLDAEGLHSCVVRTDDLSPEELVEFCDHARRRFYLRPGYVLRKLLASLRDPDERHRTLKAFGTFWRHLLRRGGR
jgi:radical SAM superfamily enzyme YgiQ (UPF0313 family)